MNLLNSFADIIRQFTGTQKLLVLILLLIFTFGSYLLSKYMQRNSCLPIIKENMEMQKDFAEISKMLREEIKNNNLAANEKKTTKKKFEPPPSGTSRNNPKMKYETLQLDTFEVNEKPIDIVPSPVIKPTINNKILQIAEKYQNK